MAFSDTWHKTLVYFGLAEERDASPADEDDHRPEPEARVQEQPRARENVRRMPSSRRRGSDFDDIFADDDPPRTTPLRAVRGSGAANGRGGGASDVRVHLVIPKSFNDAQQVADKFKDSIPVVLNLQG